MAATITAVLDACVLYPAPLRDLFMQLALADLFRAHWTEQIHEEWMRNVLADRPDLSRPKLERTRALMDAHVRDALVVGYEPLIGGLVLPDPDDRHVLAAALRCGADAIVTFNLKDFPAASLAPYGIEAQHPDGFVADLIDLDPAAACAAVRVVRGRLRNPPRTADEYLLTLEGQGLAGAVARLRTFAPLIEQMGDDRLPADRSVGSIAVGAARLARTPRRTVR
jgi:hypothetical protein